MSSYIQITEDNHYLLTDFLSLYNNRPSKHFRYYNSRSLEEYKRHLYTVIIIEERNVIGYGHIELDSKYWIALCILEEYRGKGYGGSLLRHLINVALSKRLPRLSLSVDKDNDVALLLYKKYGFVLLYEHNNYYEMILNLLPSSEIVTLPVSYGDAFDKLAILEIKMSKVSIEKKADVKKEHDAVLTSIAHLFNEAIRFYYRHLVDCSVVIWDKQVTFRSAKDNRTELCEEIIFENDRRGKLKNKVNKILSSYLVEQKDGYVLRKAYVSTHTGLGDMLTTVGIIRYLATVYDEVLYYTTREDQFSLIYSDDNTIKSTRENVCPEGYVSFIMHADQEKCDIPLCYYTLAGLKEEYFFSYFYVPTTERSKELYEKVKDKEYVIVHSSYSGGSLFTIEDVEKHLGKSRDEVVIIDINVYHEIYGDYFNMRDIIDYKDLLIHASALYLSDSFIFCLAVNLEIESNNCYYVSRWDKDYSYIYDYLPKNVNRKRFTKM